MLTGQKLSFYAGPQVYSQLPILRRYQPDVYPACVIHTHVNEEKYYDYVKHSISNRGGVITTALLQNHEVASFMSKCLDYIDHFRIFLFKIPQIAQIDWGLSLFHVWALNFS